MSFTDNYSSSIAVRQALYALTALHLRGRVIATQHKEKALRALASSYSKGYMFSNKEQLQHLAAGLLLTLFEVCTAHPIPKERRC